MRPTLYNEEIRKDHVSPDKGNKRNQLSSWNCKARTICLLIVCLSLTVTLSRAQILDFSDLNKLSTRINSAAEESLPMLSPDGKILYFTRFLHPDNTDGQYSGSDVWMADRVSVSADWSKVSNKELRVNTRWNNAVIGTSKKGDLIYFLNTKAGTPAKGISFSKKINGNWSKPEVIPIPGLSADGFLGAYVAPDYDVIIVSMKGKGSLGEEDLYVCLKNSEDEWMEPKHLGLTINSKGYEISPFLSPDKTRLYFSSNGHAGLGDGDIFYSDRLYSSWDTWSVPTNLGEKINSPFFDAYFSLFGDSLGFFCSNRDSELADIYSVQVAMKNIIGGKSRKLLSKDEYEQLFGKNTYTEFTFEPSHPALSTPQQEMLWFLMKKITSRPDISAQLITPKGDNLDKPSLYLTAMMDFVRNAGLEEWRILVEEGKQQYKPGEKIKIELLFLKPAIP